MRSRGQDERGFLLITLLLILVLLMIMGVSFTSLALWGLDQARLQRDRMMATFLARGGVQYVVNEGIPPREPGGRRSITFSQDGHPSTENESRYSCLFIKEGSLIYCTGVVEDSNGQILARRTLVVSLLTPEIFYEVSSPPKDELR